MSLEDKCVEDCEKTLQMCYDNKVVGTMQKVLEFVKPTFPKEKYQYWFNLWEDLQHREKYETRN